MLKRYLTLLFLPLLFALASCNNSSGKQEESPPAITQPKEEEPVPVQTFLLEEKTFMRELLANGKLQAKARANLQFQADGIIEQIYVLEGDRVQKGQVLAKLDMQQQQRALRQAQLRHQQALLDYQDQLLRMGYRLSDTAKLDKNTKSIARLRSGLSNAEIELKKAQANLAHTTLRAPFSGKIANLQATRHSASRSFEYFCTLINDSKLTVDFSVLEQELGFIRQSNSVRVSIFGEKEKAYTGRIVSINPIIDQSGMIAVKASVNNSDGRLLDGMSVNVTINQAVGKRLVVPKTAVLDRQERKVVFTLGDDGRAKWHYVEIEYENSREYAIKSGLEAGQKVIYSGNFNLAHDKPVRETE